jgi:tetratricopeptide (TPR) repeat protein
LKAGVTAGRDVTIQQIQIAPEQFDALLKKRLKEAMAELPTADAERRAFLLKELDAIKGKYDNLQKAHEEQKAKLAEAYKALDDFKREFAPDQIKQAQKALAQGDQQKAEALFQQAFKKSTEQAAEAAYQLGVLAESRINYQKALGYYQKAVQLQPDNHRYLNVLGNLQHDLGLFQEAQPHLEQALQIREKTLGPNHPDTAVSLNNLGELYRARGKYAKAEPLYQRALKIKEKALAPNHPSVGSSLHNLGTLYYYQGKYDKAEPLYRRALKIREETLGPDHPDVATTLNNMAKLYYVRGKYSEAEPLYRKALKISAKASLNDSGTAKLLENYAALLKKTGREGEATTLEARAQAIREKYQKTQP